METDDAWMKAVHGRPRMEGRADDARMKSRRMQRINAGQEDDLPRARK
jgi:hypothetical protein